jgi:hypothetical protein
VVPPAQHQEVEELIRREGVTQLVPQRVVDVGPVVEGVDSPDQEPLRGLDPAGLFGAAVGERGDLRPGEADTVGEERDVDTPLVLAAAAGARPVDDDLTLPHRQRELPAQLVAAPFAHRLGHRRVPYEGAEEQDRRHARRHHGLELTADPGFVGG